MYRFKMPVICIIGLILLFLCGLSLVAFAEQGDAVVNIRIQVNDAGEITGKTITPTTARIRGATRNGAEDGGRVTWKVTSNRPITATIKVSFSFEEGSPFRFDTFELGNVAINPNLPNELDSGPANVTSGRFRYRVEIQQGDRSIGGESTVIVDRQGLIIAQLGFIALGILLVVLVLAIYQNPLIAGT